MLLIDITPLIRYIIHRLDPKATPAGFKIAEMQGAEVPDSASAVAVADIPLFQSPCLKQRGITEEKKLLVVNTASSIVAHDTGSS